MAREAILLAAWDSPEGVVRQFVYQFLVESPIRVDGRTVVPTPSSSLPELALQIQLPTGLIEALDNGTKAFVISSVTKHPEDTEGDFRSRLWRDYDAKRAAFLRDYRAYWVPEQRVVLPVTRSCLVCEGALEGLRADAEYCSNACRQWAYRERQRAA